VILPEPNPIPVPQRITKEQLAAANAIEIPEGPTLAKDIPPFFRITNFHAIRDHFTPEEIDQSNQPAETAEEKQTEAILKDFIEEQHDDITQKGFLRLFSSSLFHSMKT